MGSIGAVSAKSGASGLAKKASFSAVAYDLPSVADTTRGK